MQGVAALDREELLTVTTLTCFKAYDIRGQLGAELNENIAYRIGRAYAQFLDAKRIVIGGDMRLSTAGLKQALANGLMDAGCDVIDLGMTVPKKFISLPFTSMSMVASKSPPATILSTSTA